MFAVSCQIENLILFNKSIQNEFNIQLKHYIFLMHHTNSFDFIFPVARVSTNNRKFYYKNYLGFLWIVYPTKACIDR